MKRLLFLIFSLILRERGKCEMQIIGAVMRKLIHVAYGVIKSGKPYDPLYAQNA